jgi:hypothetical protein
MVFLWITNGLKIYSYSFFLSVWLACLIFTGLVTLKTERPVWRDLYWGSLGAFIIIALIVIIILSEGDVFDGFFGGGDGHRVKKRQ